MTAHLNGAQKAFRNLKRATVLLFVINIALVTYTFVNASSQRNQVRDLATSTNTALCTFVDDLHRRIESSRQFLDNHPRGVGGITASDIRLSIHNQRLTLDALSALEC